MPRWGVVMVGAALLAGCPGQRRPDPRAAAREPSVQPTEPATTPAAPVASGGRLAARRARVTELEARFRAAPSERARWQELVDAISAAEDAAFEVQESDEGGAALEELSALRSDVVQLEPR